MTTLVQRKFVMLAQLLGAIGTYSANSSADNPIVQTNYTADPAPMVYDGRLYVYTSHDEDVTVSNFFTMNDWRLYSTTDVVNWTDHGSPLSYKSFSWSSGKAWAGQCVPRNGKFYYYVPVQQSTGAQVIGVAVSSSPTGPFTDALKKPLVTSGSDTIDPTVFIDADGQAYLYWGNPNLWYVKLNEDMISYSGTPTKVNLTTAGFGTRSKTDRATAYEEGPWFYKRGSLYYIVYPGDGVPENISYTTSSSPIGPWKFGGVIMDKESGNGASFTNHPGVADFRGNSYIFYHNGALPGGGGYKRSVAVEKFSYNADGTIPKIAMTTAGPPGIGNLNPYVTTEAETMAWESGIETEVCGEGGMNVTAISNGDYIKVKGVDFGTGATSFSARVASAAGGGNIEVRLNSQTGTLAGTCAVSATGGAQTWTTKTCTISGASGVHDLFFVFTGSGTFNFNNWQFTGSGSGTGGTGSGGTSATGGTQFTGGTSAAGGTQTAGGSANAGGRPTSGGNTSKGSMTTTGSSVATGGTSVGTGSTGPIGGSPVATGGAPTINGGNTTNSQLTNGGALAAGGFFGVGGSRTDSDSATVSAGDSPDDGSCGCRLSNSRARSRSLTVFVVLGLLIFRPKKRSRHSSSLS
jgi:hypothetical protein